MKTFVIVFFSFIVLFGCKTNPSKPLPPKLKVLDKQQQLSSKDSILYWASDSYNINDDLTFEKYSSVIKNYKINNGKLYDLKNNIVLDNIYITYHKDKKNTEDIYIIKGLPQGVYYSSKEIFKDWRTFKYDEKGNLNGSFTIANYTTTFNEGNGYWKDYYFNNAKTNYVLKEEGGISKNFKVGKWSYYSNKGQLVQTKEYSLKDSIDVRFPHCLFNKNEPCF
ncbi:hypothetical protein [uncultured Lacinutrix sp.]|uniref:hypothetical protein n=1 Tax=uncultured Lacinutrix sp. TaxID=574032 RepID=UPI00260C320A|nr:hypothetical protein [uncultured Lacinutrix sp.]